MPIATLAHLDLLKEGKNLLAFSAGVDSSALFFLLLEYGITFDIAIVDYGLREQSQTEVAHAKALAKKHHLTCYTTKAPLFHSDFEKEARDFRYAFFDTLMRQKGYTNLLTAHQLNDRLEWFLMRLVKGAGTYELAGLDSVVPKEGYHIVRPLLETTKAQLLAYLQAHDYPYFIDESNMHEEFERNRFRNEFADALIERYAEGIKRTFAYLQEDKALIKRRFETIWSHNELYVIRLYDASVKAKAVDDTLKRLGYLLSAAQRREIVQNSGVVIGGKWAVEQSGDLLYIAPYVQAIMPKEFKEACRIRRIPPKIRPYLWQEGIDLDTLLPIHKP